MDLDEQVSRFGADSLLPPKEPTKAMKIAALVTACKAHGQLINAQFSRYDRETAELMAALSAWVLKHEKQR